LTIVPTESVLSIEKVSQKRNSHMKNGFKRVGESEGWIWKEDGGFVVMRK